MECPVALAVAAVAVAVIIDSMTKEIREFFPLLLNDFPLSFYLNSGVKARCEPVSGEYKFFFPVNEKEKIRCEGGVGCMRIFIT